MDPKLIQELVDVGCGKLRHVYMGSCPDSLEGSTVRDRGCPACKVLLAGARAAKELRAAERRAPEAAA
jgi:hypothetical protein